MKLVGIRDLRISESLYQHLSSSQGKSFPLKNWEEKRPFPSDFAKKNHRSGKEFPEMGGS